MDPPVQILLDLNVLMVADVMCFYDTGWGEGQKKSVNLLAVSN